MGDIKRFTFAEVSAYNGKNNSQAYMVYKDSVYDITRYVNEHPGGPDILLDEAGKDATKEFDGVGHSVDARVIMAKLKVGEIIEEEKIYDENGKKKKRVVSAAPEDNPRGFCSKLTCGLVG